MSKELKDQLDKIEDNIANSFEDAALAYFNVGIDLYEKEMQCSSGYAQVVVGNLSIACELLLKTVISRKMFLSLFMKSPNELPHEVLSRFHYWEFITGEITPNKFIRALEKFEYNTISLKQASSLFYKLNPQNKRRFKYHLDSLAQFRNFSVHAVLQESQNNQLDKVAYNTCDLFGFVENCNILKKSLSDSIKLKVENIITQYKEKNKKQFDKYTMATKGMENVFEFRMPQESNFNKWKSRVEECPDCGNKNALCHGHTDCIGGTRTLVFDNEKFECSKCKLTLKSITKLRAVGIKVSIEIDEDFYEWSAYNKKHPLSVDLSVPESDNDFYS